MSQKQRVFWVVTCSAIALVFVINGAWSVARNATEVTRTAIGSTAPVSTPTAVPVPAPVPITVSTPTVTHTIHDSEARRIIDGDTFELADGTKVRILGIDSCEMSTPAGPRAKEDLEVYMGRVYLQLVAEPGVDKDRYGRLLRYVLASGTDVGKYMVGYDHTAVYAGKNDASAAYVADLRARDTDGRNCAAVPPAPVTEDNYVPVPDSNDDGDGGKSRHCRRHWYC